MRSTDPVAERVAEIAIRKFDHSQAGRNGLDPRCAFISTSRQPVKESGEVVGGAVFLLGIKLEDSLTRGLLQKIRREHSLESTTLESSEKNKPGNSQNFHKHPSD